MSFRDWLPNPPIGVGLAVALLFVLAGLQNHSNNSKHADARAKQQDQYSAQQALQARVAPVIRNEAPVADPNPDREEWRKEQDLQAQKNMALWAFWMFIASALSVGVTAIGVVYVRRTLQANLAAVAAANRTADEAREVGQAQVRAYLYCEGATYRITPQFFFLEMCIQNAGQSPARSCRIKSQLSVQTAVYGADGVPHFNYVHTEDEEGIGPPIPVGSPGRIVKIWLHGEVGADAYASLSEGEASFDVSCSLKWKDVFGEELSLTFFLYREGNDGIDPNDNARFGKMRAYASPQNAYYQSGANRSRRQPM